VRAKSLNIRTKPSIESSIIGTLAKGTEVRIFDEVDGWYAISSSQSRWVKVEYIENIKQNPGGS
jgi:N-acetylmuramoyl-L-alanine amidase